MNRDDVIRLYYGEVQVNGARGAANRVAAALGISDDTVRRYIAAYEKPAKTTRQTEREQRTRLTREHSAYNTEALADWLSLATSSIENGLLQSGATPGVDYTFRDLFGWAVALNGVEGACERAYQALRSVDEKTDPDELRAAIEKALSALERLLW